MFLYFFLSIFLFVKCQCVSLCASSVCELESGVKKGEKKRGKGRESGSRGRVSRSRFVRHHFLFFLLLLLRSTAISVRAQPCRLARSRSPTLSEREPIASTFPPASRSERTKGQGAFSKKKKKKDCNRIRSGFLPLSLNPNLLASLSLSPASALLLRGVPPSLLHRGNKRKWPSSAGPPSGSPGSACSSARWSCCWSGRCGGCCSRRRGRRRRRRRSSSRRRRRWRLLLLRQPLLTRPRRITQAGLPTVSAKPRPPHSSSDSSRCSSSNSSRASAPATEGCSSASRPSQ